MQQSSLRMCAPGLVLIMFQNMSPCLACFVGADFSVDVHEHTAAPGAASVNCRQSSRCEFPTAGDDDGDIIMLR